jgi:hypothetical protein
MPFWSSIKTKYRFDDFTESAYKVCLSVAQKKYEFIRFVDYQSSGKLCLWRHDVDLSPQRGLALAKIEADSSINSTFFVHFHSDYYNLLEGEVVQLVKAIHTLGHDIGLHFDLAFYQGSIQSSADLEPLLIFEKNILEKTLGINVQSFSFHNPIAHPDIRIGDEMLGGMVNAYSDFIKEKFSYCSDSFCYWRYKRLLDVLENEDNQYLQILTHPECWSKQALSPYKRILRAINGRRDKTISKYLSRSQKFGRKIIR